MPTFENYVEGQTALTIADDDEFTLRDASASTVNKLTYAGLKTALNTQYSPLADTMLWVPAGAFGVVDGSPAIVASSGISTTWRFDQTAQEGIAASVAFPPGWATFNVRLYWANSAAGSGAVVWYSDSVPLTAGVDIDGVVGNLINSVASTALGLRILVITAPGSTVNVPATGVLGFRVFRFAAEVADTLPNDASLVGALFTRVS